MGNFALFAYTFEKYFESSMYEVRSYLAICYLKPGRIFKKVKKLA